jgi:peroxiredoxin
MIDQSQQSSSSLSSSPVTKLEALKEGEVAPDFTLRTTPDQTLSLKDFLGSPVILAFYPADFSPVCGDEMSLYNEIYPNFNDLVLK